MLAPAGLQSTDGSDPRNQPDERTALARGQDYGSPRLRTGRGVLRRADDKERSLPACLDGARVRGSAVLWRTGHPTLNCRSAELEQGNKNAENENKSPRVRAAPVTIKSSPPASRPAGAHELKLIEQLRACSRTRRAFGRELGLRRIRRPHPLCRPVSARWRGPT